MAVLLGIVGCTLFMVLAVQGRSVSLGQYPYDGYRLQDTQYKLALPGSQRCFEELGCFETGGVFFHPLYRPVNLLPDYRESIGVKFLLHTPENIQTPNVLYWNSTVQDWKKSLFDFRLPTKMIVHGWLDTQFLGKWMSDMKDAFLRRGKYNVIITDWQGGNGLPYTQAVANTRVVGAEMALVIEKLGKAFGVSPASFHLLGHSLGGQVVGYAGKRTNGLGRITAMDPAEPLYQNMPPEVHTTPSDAQFVEGIHTDSSSFITHMGLGMIQPVGHVDFYPNGGEFMPGCEVKNRIRRFLSGGIIDGVRDIVACNHVKALEYVLDAINNSNRECTHVAHACQNYDLFQMGACADCGEDGSRCASMNIDDTSAFEKFKNDNVSVKMYLNTGPGAPFCLFHYQVTVKMMLPRNGIKAVSGKYYFTIHGDKDSAELLLNTKPVSMEPGSQHRFLATTSVDVGELMGYSFRWSSSSFFSKPTMYLDFVQITPMNKADTKYERKKHRLCMDDPRKGVSHSQPVTLSPCFTG